jgi:cytochrome c oxidase cbb3-type subunit 2
MPSYAFLAKAPLDYKYMADHLKANRAVGVPYTDEMIADAVKDVETQVNPDSADAAGLVKRYPKAQIRDFDGNPEMISEMDALIAYLQVLGTFVDFNLYKSDAQSQR